MTRLTRTPLGLIGLLLALGATESAATRTEASLKAQPRRALPYYLRTRSPVLGSPHRPHQNLRECARRVGGQVWRDYRNARREARGLPPR